MKQLMLTMGLIGLVVFTQAAEQSKSKPAVIIEQGVRLLPIAPVTGPETDVESYECTMSASITVTVGVVKVEATCSATGTTCEQALATAEGCVTAVIKRFTSIIK